MTTPKSKGTRLRVPSQRAISVPIGTPASCESEAVLHVQVKNADQPVALGMPGGILRVGKNCLPTIIPFVRVSTGKGKERKSALVQFAETDLTETDEALRELGEDMERRRPEGFLLYAAADELTFGELVDLAVKGKIGRKAPQPVKLQVAMRLRGVKKPVLSKPFPGQIGAVAITEDTLDYEDVFGLYFDCHSHWYGLRAGTRFTVCHGPCPGAANCSCGTPAARRCKGWCFCWC